MKRLIAILLVLSMVFSMIPAVFAASGTTVIQDLEVDQRTNPMGIDNKTPEFRWEMVSDVYGQKQTAYQIVVKDGETVVWDTGKVESDVSNAIPYAGTALESGTRYTWDVTVWDKDGNTLTCDENPWFEMGLLNRSDWNGAAFIAPSTGVADFVAPTNYSIEMELQVVKDGAGFAFGAKDGNNFLMWQINTWDYTTNNPSYGGTENKVYFRPHKWENGGAACVGEIDISDIVAWEDAYQPHSMKIEVKGTTVYTYIDGVKLDWTYTHNLAKFNQIGFRHSTSSNVAESSKFSSITITNDDTGAVLYTNDFSENMKPFTSGSLSNGWINAPMNAVALADPMAASVGTSAPMFRKEFTVKEGLVSARLYATSLGIYEAYINGQKVGTDKMAPGWTDYYDYVQYQTHDVTNMLTTGANAMGAIVGNGWYSGHVSTGNRVNIYGTDEAYLSQLVLTYADGTTETVVTDNTWQAFTEGPFVDTCNQNGETYDARLEIDGWAEAGLDTSKWLGTKVATKKNIKTNVNPETIGLVAQPEDPVTVIETMQPKFLAKTGEDTYVYDIGQNISGIVRIKVEGAAGTTLKLRHGEMVYKDTNALYTANLREAKATDYYTLKGTEGGEVYEPTFTFHGFRYFEVSGLGYQPAEEDLEALVIHSQLDRTGYVETNNAMVNQLFSNIIWGHRDNYLSIATDCPQRDERLGWTGDATVFSRTASMNFDINAFYTKYIRDVEYARDRNTGSIYSIAPADGHPVGGGASVWGDFAVVGPWTMYTTYGDTAILEENWDMMTDWIGYYQSTKAGSDYLVDSDTYGDWLAISESTNSGYVSTAYYAYVTGLVAKMAEILGKDDEAAKYTELYNNIVTAFNNKHVNQQTGKLSSDTQTAYCLAICFDLIPDPAVYQKVCDNLVARVEAMGWHLSGGFVGIEYLLPALTKAGYNDVAYQLLLTETYPSWLYSVKNGATTMWERWNSYIAETGTFGDVGMNSFNHYSFGAVASWMYQYAGGIQFDVDNPGYKHFTLAPNPDKQLNEFKVEYESVYGRIVSDWTLADGKFTLNATIPANTTATVVIPSDDADALTVTGAAECVQYLGTENGKATYEVQSGSYVFESAIKERVTVSASADSSVEGGTLTKVTVNGEAGRATVAQGETVTVEAAATNPEWEFVSWTGGVESSENPLVVKADKDMNLSASFRYVGRENLALGKKVTVSSNDGGAPAWAASNLTDGKYITVGSVNGWTSGKLDKDACNVTVQIDLGAENSINRVQLYPRTDATNANGKAAAFPKDFTIAVSKDNQNWETVATYTDFAAPEIGAPLVIDFDLKMARYVKLNVTKTNDMATNDTLDRVQLAEFGVYNTSELEAEYNVTIDGNGAVEVNGELVELPFSGMFATKTDVTVEAVSSASKLFQSWSGSVNSTEAKVNLYINGNKTLTASFGSPADINLALKKPVIAPDNLSSGSAWGKELLTDGNTVQGTGYSTATAYDKNGAPDVDVTVDIDLGKTTLLDKVLIYPRSTPAEKTPDGKVSSYPRDFTLQVSNDGKTWTTVKTVVDERTPEWLNVNGTEVAETMPYELDQPSFGRYLRLHVTKAGLVEASDLYYRVQLREIEIYNEKFVESIAFTSADEVMIGARAAGLATELTATLADGSTMVLDNADLDITYTVSDETVATVDENGVVTGLKDGKVILTASVTINGIAFSTEQELTVGRPIVPVALTIAGTDLVTVNDTETTFTVGVQDAVNLANVVFTMDVDQATIADVTTKALGDWFVVFESYENGKLTMVLGNKAGVNDTADVVEITAALTGTTGSAAVAITDAELAAYLQDGTETFVDVLLEGASFTTEVDYGTYDVNCDGIVNMLDITRAQRYYGTEAGQEPWYARADVNGDDTVNILDFVLILNNYTR